MKQNQKNYDAIIIGGGHNGLVAASYLAKAGKSVLLLEAHDELGGTTTSGRGVSNLCLRSAADRITLRALCRP